MQDITERTGAVVRKMFSAEQRADVEEFLKVECADNLPLCEKLDAKGLERVRFAVLKLSQGNLDALLQAIEAAQTDWRDIFMAAGFGYDITEHDRWANEYLSDD